MREPSSLPTTLLCVLSCIVEGHETEVQVLERMSQEMPVKDTRKRES
jgi:hypothetical protein